MITAATAPKSFFNTQVYGRPIINKSIVPAAQYVERLEASIAIAEAMA